MRRSSRQSRPGRPLLVIQALVVASLLWGLAAVALAAPVLATGQPATDRTVAGGIPGWPTGVSPMGFPSTPSRSATPTGAAAGGPGPAGAVGPSTTASPTSVRSPASVVPSPSLPASPSPSPAPAQALVTDTISLFGFVCAGTDAGETVVYSRNPRLAEPGEGCREARSGELTVTVMDAANPAVVYDRVETGPAGYANAVVPVGRFFVLTLATPGTTPSVADRSPVYRLSPDPDQRQPIAVRIFRLVPATAGGGSTSPGSVVGGTPVSGAMTEPVTILGLVCVSDTRAGIYDYLPGLVTSGLDGGQCRRATVDELEFLLLDNDNPSRLYDDALTGIDGVAIAEAPVDRPFFVTEFGDDPGSETGIPGGSAAITIPADPAARQPVSLTVVRNVAPGALDLAAGTVLVSTVVCPPVAGPASLTVLGPAPDILIRPEGVPASTPQPGSGPGCEEAGGAYEIAPYGDETVDPVEVEDGAADGALVVPLPATITRDGTRVFPAYRLTETTTGQTTTFDVQEGAWTSLRVVLVDRPATPVPAAGDATAANAIAGTAEAGLPDAATTAGTLPATPTTAVGPVASAAVATPPVTPDENDSGFLASPIRLLWATLTVLAIGIFLAGTWVLRRPGHRWRRRPG